MEVIKGKSILDFEEGVICHQVNCLRKAGAGLALAIRSKYPGWFENWIDNTPLLGSVHFYMVSINLVIASIYGQVDIGKKITRVRKQYTEYDALENGLQIVNHTVPDHWTIYIPKGIGCGLGGGDWKTVSEIIERIIPRAILVDKESK